MRKGIARLGKSGFFEVMARSLVAAGARPGMILHNCYPYRLFTTRLEVHDGAEKLGMTVVPNSIFLAHTLVILRLLRKTPSCFSMPE